MWCGLARRIAVATALTAMAHGALAASFNCAKAATVIERAICSSPELSSLDDQLSESYKAALGKAADPEQLKAAQRSWLRDVRGKCETGPCLTEVYKRRVAALTPLLPQALAATVPPTALPPNAPTPAAVKNAQPTDAISRCDALAAHPEDPERVAAGISDEKINASAAVLACEAAVKAEPSTPRLHFQLGRSYLAADQLEQAVEQFILAAQEDHGGALAYLADFYIAGAPGIEADPQLAYRLYQKSLSAQFEPARKILSDFQDKTTEFATAEKQHDVAANANVSPPTTYMHGDIINLIGSKQFDKIPYDEQWVKAYLVNIAENVETVCGTSIVTKPIEQLKKTADADPANLSRRAFSEGRGVDMRVATYISYLVKYFGKDEESSAGIEILEGSLNDTVALIQRSPCGSSNLTQFGRNLQSFVENSEAPLREDAIFDACMSSGNSATVTGREYCSCFSTRLSQVPVSQGNRKLLLSSFVVAARSISTQSEKARNSFYLCGR